MSIAAVKIVGIGAIAIKDLTINYTDNYYEIRINKLENYAKQLSNKADKIEDLIHQGSVAGFFKGSDSDKTMQILKTGLDNVRRAEKQVEELKLEYEGYRNQMHEDSRTIGKVLDVMSEAAGKLNVK